MSTKHRPKPIQTALLPLAMFLLTSCDSERSIENSRRSNHEIQQFSTDATEIGLLQFDQSKTYRFTISPETYRPEEPSDLNDQQEEIFFSSWASRHKIGSPVNEPLRLWYAADRFQDPKWNLARVTIRSPSLTYSTDPKDYPLRNLDPETTRVQFSSTTKLVIADRDSIAVFVADDETQKITSKIFKIQNGFTNIFYASDDRIWIKQDNQTIHSLKIIAEGVNLQLRSQKFSTSDFDVAAICTMDTGTLFVGREVNYFWPIGEKKLFSAHSDQPELLDKLKLPTQVAQNSTANPNACIFSTPSSNEQTMYKVEITGNR